MITSTSCVSLLLLLLILLSCPYKATAVDPQFSTLRIATPAWEGQTSANGTGLYCDLVRAIYEPEGIKVKITIVPPKRTMLLLQQKKTDASFGYLSAELMKIIGFNSCLIPRHPINTDRLLAMFKRDTCTDWHYPDCLKGKRVGWIDGYNFTNRIAVPLHFVRLTTQEQGWDLLRFGRLDFYLDYQHDTLKTIQRCDIDTKDYSVQTLSQDNIYM